MNPPRSSSLGERLRALVPASLPPVSTRRLPKPVRRLVGRVRTAVQDALDLPSRTELRQVMTHLETVTRRLDHMEQEPSAAPETNGSAESRIAELEDERRKLKKLRKELKRELKTVADKRSRNSKSKSRSKGKGKGKGKGKQKDKGQSKTTTTINVGSPKSMKDRAEKKSKKD